MKTPHHSAPAHHACAAVLVLLSPLTAQISFGSAANLVVGNQPDEIAVGDVDADGDLDFVVAAGGEFQELAHNQFGDDASCANASPIAHDGCLLMRTERYLYCIGKTQTSEKN